MKTSSNGCLEITDICVPCTTHIYKPWPVPRQQKLRIVSHTFLTIPSMLDTPAKLPTSMRCTSAQKWGAEPQANKQKHMRLSSTAAVDSTFIQSQNRHRSKIHVIGIIVHHWYERGYKIVTCYVWSGCGNLWLNVTRGVRVLFFSHTECIKSFDNGNLNGKKSNENLAYVQMFALLNLLLVCFLSYLPLYFNNKKNNLKRKINWKYPK